MRLFFPLLCPHLILLLLTSLYNNLTVSHLRARAFAARGIALTTWAPAKEPWGGRIPPWMAPALYSPLLSQA